jgi:hypothetical protein
MARSQSNQIKWKGHRIQKNQLNVQWFSWKPSLEVPPYDNAQKVYLHLVLLVSRIFIYPSLYFSGKFTCIFM